MSEKIVIRLVSHGQYAVKDHKEDLLKELNEIDNQIVALLSETEAKMQKLLAQMEKKVAEQGESVIDEFIGSDLVLPPADLSLSEAASIFQGEGILPG